MSIVVFLIQLVFRLLCWWDSMVYFGIPRRQHLTANFLFLWSYNLFTPAAMISEPRVQELYCRCSRWYWIPQLSFQLPVALYNGLSLLQRVVSLVRG